MRHRRTRRPGPSLRGVLVATLALIAVPAFAQETVHGTYALPDGKPKVTATLAVRPGAGLRRTLDITMAPIGGTAPFRQYEVELSKQMHVIAVDGALQAFVHEHGERPDPGGHFRIGMAFPHQGLWRVYADAVPRGMGQQVVRFELPVGAAPSAGIRPDLAPTGLLSSDGRYAVQIEAAEFKAGQESELGLHLLRDGKPAPDVTPYLGVAAHAVLINAGDLTYVHVHAVAAGGPSSTSAGTHAHADVPAMASAGAHAGPMAGMEGMSAPLAPRSSVQPDLVVHLRPPGPGDYVMWVQFMGGGKVRTVRFVVPAR